jgi:hypothetical protein
MDKYLQTTHLDVASSQHGERVLREFIAALMSARVD